RPRGRGGRTEIHGASFRQFLLQRRVRDRDRAGLLRAHPPVALRRSEAEAPTGVVRRAIAVMVTTLVGGASAAIFSRLPPLKKGVWGICSSPNKGSRLKPLAQGWR